MGEVDELSHLGLSQMMQKEKKAGWDYVPNPASVFEIRTKSTLNWNEKLLISSH